MMQRFTPFLVAFFCVVGFSAIAQDLKNTSFEDWTYDDILDYNTVDDWRAEYVYGIDQAIIESSDAQDGSSSLLVENNGFGTAGEITQAIANATFSANGFVGFYKSSIAEGDAAIIRVTYRKGDDEILSTSEITIETSVTEWTRFQVQLDKKNAADSIDIYFTNSRDGKDSKIWIDNISFDQLVSLDEPASATTTNLFPNPASDAVTVQFSETSGSANITMLDMTGRIVYQANNEAITANGHTIQTAGYEPGMYLVRTEQNGVLSVSQVVIK